MTTLLLVEGHQQEVSKVPYDQDNGRSLESFARCVHLNGSRRGIFDGIKV